LKKDIVRRWEKKEETTVLVASGPGGRRLDLVIQDPTITVRTRIIEALEISKVDDVQDTIIIVCNGKRKEQTMILPLNGQTVDAQDKIKSALSAAQVNGLYDVANTLERALQQVNMRR
jgi:outer membrane lipopolysaccharide assembly protein LptE/RlpB